MNRAQAETQLAKMNAQTQADTRALVTTFRDKGSLVATAELLKLAKARKWPRWVMFAIRDTVLGLAQGMP